MQCFFTITSNSIFTRNIYAVVMSTVFLLPFFYVCYTAIDNSKIYIALPSFDNSSYIDIYNKINVENDGDIHSMCDRTDEIDVCLRFFSEQITPLINSPVFMDALNLIPDDADSSVIISNRWWWPAPLLRQSKDVQGLLYVSELKQRLLGRPSFDEIISEDMFDLDRAFIALALLLIAINTGLALFYMHLNDKRVKYGGEPVSMYKEVFSASLIFYAALLYKLVLFGIFMAFN